MISGSSVLITCLALLTPLCAAQTSPSVTSDEAALVSGSNAFAVELYQRLRTTLKGNLFFSPESISTSLAMTYTGARGSTASEMATTLHYSLPPDRLNPAMDVWLTDLNGAHEGYQLRVADALWAQEGYIFQDAFLKVMTEDYAAGFQQVDFKNDSSAARLTINHWVEQHTDNKIQGLLQPGSLGSKTRLVLTNAVYFKGDWETQFDKTQTKDETFHQSQEGVLKTPLMHREGQFNYFNGGTFQALEIPYKSGEVSMVVLLPNDVSGLSALERSLTPSSAEQWLHQLRPAPKVIVTVPKFTMTRQFELQDVLSAMGMPQAFDRNAANFSGMDGKRDFSISAVIHKAYIDVDEQGTEAAAATAVAVVRSEMARGPDLAVPIIFRADHPFIFLIRDNRSGGILFMGRVNDPTKTD